MKSDSRAQIVSTSCSVEGRVAGNGEAGLAEGAVGGVLSDVQNALLASIEARLADEVLRLIDPIHQFGVRAQLIGKEIPDGAQFCKLITSLLALTAFQHAYALRQMADTPIFVDDGAGYLRKLGLELKDLFREVELDGRKFMAVALIDQQTADLDKASSKGEICG